MTNFFIQPNWPAPACIKAYTTLRSSKIGLPDYENPQSGNLNRRLLKQSLALPNEPVWITQIHSAIALKAIPLHAEQKADALFTDETNQVCAVLTADCLPVLIAHRQGTHVAAIHAGWRGLAGGILEATLLKMNLCAADLLIWLGPAIGPSKFTVRKDVYDAFTQLHREAIQGFQQISADQWLANLYTLARLRLEKCGVSQIYGGEFCTYTDQERFYSYRRDGKMTGRIVSLIWIADSQANLE